MVRLARAAVAQPLLIVDDDGQGSAMSCDAPGATFTIYNRWGREVYTSTNYRNTWGTDPNIAAGVYYYLLTDRNGAQTKGWIEVVR